VCALPKQAAEQAGSRPIERENAARGWVEKDGGRKRAAWWISASRLRRRSLLAPLLLRGSTWYAFASPLQWTLLLRDWIFGSFFQAVIFTRLSLFLIRVLHLDAPKIQSFRVLRDSAFAGDWIGGMVGVDGWVWLVG